MKKILLLAALLWSAAALAQTSVWKIANQLAKEGTKWEYVLESSDFQGCLDSFCGRFPDNTLIAALYGSDALPVVQRYRAENYARIQLNEEPFAELEARLWSVPSGNKVFIIKLINYDEDTVPQIYFFSVGQDRMKRILDPDGLRFGTIVNFRVTEDADFIEVENDGFQSDKIAILDDGTVVFESFAPDAIDVWVDDPDPSGKTNIRATPGGKVIGRLGDWKPGPGDEECPDEGPGSIIVFGPRNGWWQILGYVIEGIDISQGGWIHWSVLATGTRNYSGEPIPLHKEPSADSPVVGTIKKADVTVRPMDITPDGSWVKVKSAYGTGWLEVDWLCGNPFTTCA